MTHRTAALNVIALSVAAAFAGLAPGALAQTITVTGDVSPPGIVGPNADIGAANLVVGNTATGSISVLNGATFSGQSFLLGESASGNGSMTVGGAGASATANNSIGVGRSGTGVLNILSGGTVSTVSGSINLGDLTGGAAGTINVNGGTLAAGTAAASVSIRVGRRSTAGSLNITNGGRVTLGHAGSGVGLDDGNILQIGGSSGSADQTGRGSVLVSGAGSTLELLGENTRLNVGRNGAVGTSTLTIEMGGVVNTEHFVSIGRSLVDGSGAPVPGSGATGVVVVDGAGSRLSMKGIPTSGADQGKGPVLSVGLEGGTGTLTIRNGGLVQLDGRGATSSALNGSGGASVASGSASTGTLNIQNGGRLELLSDSNVDSFGMTVGRLGTGALNVTNGGQLLIRNTGTGGLGMPFGGNSSSGTGGSFSGLISGAGTSVVLEGIDADITVGNRSGSSGTVTIEAGAMVAPGNRLAVGHNTGASGILNIRGTGTTINIKSLAADEFGAGITVGRVGNGIANITDGAIVNVDGTGGAQRHSTNIGGSGTASGGTGTLNISGATTRYNVTGASTSLVIGRDDTGASPSTGTMMISSGAQVSFPSAGQGAIGYSPGSTGSLTVTGADSRLDMGAFLGIGRSISDNPGGTGLLNVSDGGVAKATNIHVGTGGTIAGNGTLDGSVINDGAINPGNSPGTLSIAGNLTLTNSSVLTFEVAGASPGQFDVIAVGGSLTADGILRVVNTSGYVPVAGDTLSLITFATRTGDFDSIVLEGFGAGADLMGSFSSGAFQVTAVPEPYEWALMLVGLVMLRLAVRGRSHRFMAV
jgi:T5SS/PEP-CTERM-associated repeat protein